MKNVIIWGVGQGGRMVANLLHADITVRAFSDSDESKWGGSLDGIPVVPPESIPDLEPDAVFISMLNADACASVRERLAAMNVAARIVTAPELRRTFDQRLATLRMIAGEVRERGIGGAVAELGVYQGALAAEMNRLFPDRSLYLFDTFTGFDGRDVAVEGERRFSRAEAGNFADTSVEAVRARLPHPERAMSTTTTTPDSPEPGTPCDSSAKRTRSSSSPCRTCTARGSSSNRERGARFRPEAGPFHSGRPQGGYLDLR
jgi:O-methyltransferase